MKKWHLNFETVASVCAIITSVVALFVAWDQSVVMRAQQHASVWPIVKADIIINQNEKQNFIEFNIANVGVGPAIIKHSDLYINDQRVEEFDLFSEAILVGTQKQAISVEFDSFNGVLGAGERRTALKMWWPRNDNSDRDFIKMAERFVVSDNSFIVEQCYCSVFERCFVSRSDDSLGPVSVPECPIDDGDPVELIKSSMQVDTKVE